jgi:hypothetical protein
MRFEPSCYIVGGIRSWGRSSEFGVRKVKGKENRLAIPTEGYEHVWDETGRAHTSDESMNGKTWDW